MPTPTTTASVWFACSLLGLAAACDPPPPEPVFPAEWASSFQEVRDCRRSGDHDLGYVRVLADANALDPYLTRSAAFPVGSVILKVEHADPDCTQVTGFTAMRREPPGYAPSSGDWRWQKAGADRAVAQDGVIMRCIGCHQICGTPPDGHDWSCAVP